MKYQKSRYIKKKKNYFYTNIVNCNLSLGNIKTILHKKKTNLFFLLCLEISFYFYKKKKLNLLLYWMKQIYTVWMS